jgi:hypothetical protein
LPALAAGPWEEWDRLTKIIMPRQGSPEALEASRQLLQTWPPSPDNGGGSLPFRQQIYCTASLIVARDLGDTQRQYSEAVAVIDSYFRGFEGPEPRVLTATTRGDLDFLRLRYLLQAQLTPEQAWTAAQTSARRVEAGFTPLDTQLKLSDYLGNVVLLYEKGLKPEEGLTFLESLPIQRADIIREIGYWELLVGKRVQAKQLEEAKQAAVWAFRFCPFQENAVSKSLDLLVKGLMLTGNGALLDKFLAYLKTGEGENPLAGVPLPKLSPELAEQTVAATGYKNKPLVDAYLYTGQFPEALQTAQSWAASGDAKAAEGLTDLARCFKAKDTNLLRANQFVHWAKSGEGANPVEGF